MSEATVEEYLAVSGQFKLGRLLTEGSNPLTENLSVLCQNPETVGEALNTLQHVDLAALRVLVEKAPLLVPLAEAVHETLSKGKKIVCAGCGATGRLSLSLEAFTRMGMVHEERFRDKVLGFMAGGDAAFIRSIEQFEDKVAFGKRQLHDIGFEDGDLMIAITEGGETPFVIAACEEALVVSPGQRPWFVYCNPDSILREVAQRSANVIDNDKIMKLNLCVGPMSITGSTRMQATTVQLAAVGLAIQNHNDHAKIPVSLRRLLAATESFHYALLAPITKLESQFYKDGEFFTYMADFLSVTVMTDTTERAPTFSMPPFENFDQPEQLSSPVYLCINSATGALDGWTSLLRRAPRPLEWEETRTRTGISAIKGYDFSSSVFEKRAARVGAEKTRNSVDVSVDQAGSRLVFSAKQQNLTVSVAFSDGEVVSDLLLINIVAKMILNAHSTTVMGILGRFEGNVMIWVRPTNNKLIDRAARYVTLIVSRRLAAMDPAEVARKKLTVPTYEQICTKIYQLREQLTADKPIVIYAAEYFLGEKE
jgi:N-acetylmuramic acid 6-phosphate etherase